MQQLRGSLGFHRLLIICSIVLPRVWPADSTCDAKIIEAMKTQYTLSTDVDSATAVYEAACNVRDSRGGGSISFAGVALSGQGQDVTRACATKDMNFFANQKLQLATSFLPDSAIPAILAVCGGDDRDLTITATLSPEGSLVTIRATYRPTTGGGEPFIIKNLTVVPVDALGCTQKELHDADLGTGDKVVPDGRSITCKRTLRTEFSITLVGNTFSSKRIIMPAEHTVILKRVKWNHTVLTNPPDNHTVVCRDDSDSDLPIVTGPTYRCDDHGSCNLNEDVSGVCAMLNKERSCYIAIDGVHVPYSYRACE
jgi:hypothetical protein